MGGEGRQREDGEEQTQRSTRVPGREADGDGPREEGSPSERGLAGVGGEREEQGEGGRDLFASFWSASRCILLLSSENFCCWKKRSRFVCEGARGEARWQREGESRCRQARRGREISERKRGNHHENTGQMVHVLGNLLLSLSLHLPQAPIILSLFLALL